MKNFVKRLLATTGLAACMLTVAPQANAFTFDEQVDPAGKFDPQRDAGQLIDTAFNAGNADQINGEVGLQKDIDLFKILTGAAGKTTFDGNPIAAADGSQLNINLFLFNAAGNPLFSLEPMASDSMKFDFDTLADTVYYLGIGSDDLDALDNMGNRIAGNDSGIDNPDGVLAGWSAGNESIGKYNITIATVPIDAVPTPMLLPGLIALGAKVRRQKKQGAATLAEGAVDA
jgi:hypothetical protein